MSDGVLDTSNFILLRRLADASALPAAPSITAVTLAELGVGPLIAEDEALRAQRQRTCNPADFAGIEGLELVTVPHLDAADA